MKTMVVTQARTWLMVGLLVLAMGYLFAIGQLVQLNLNDLQHPATAATDTAPASHLEARRYITPTISLAQLSPSVLSVEVEVGPLLTN